MENEEIAKRFHQDLGNGIYHRGVSHRAVLAGYDQAGNPLYSLAVHAGVPETGIQVGAGSPCDITIVNTFSGSAAYRGIPPHVHGTLYNCICAKCLAGQAKNSP